MADSNFVVKNSLTVNTVFFANSTTITGNSFVANNSGIYSTGLVNATAFTTTGVANVATVYATSSANIASVVLANASGIFTTGTVNALSITTSGVTVNTTGVYGGVINASSYTIGSVFVANTTTLNSNGFIANSTGSYVNGAVNAASYTVGSIFVANTTTLNSNGFVVNSTGAFVTGLVNAASYTVGTNFIANSSQLTLSTIPFSANGSNGTSGFVLTSNGSTGAPYWSSAGFANGQSITVNNFVITGNLTANSSNGTSGQVLTSNGIGVYWTTPSSSGGVRQQYTGDGSTTVFTVTGGYAIGNLDVFVNGVKVRDGSDVTTNNGSTFTFTVAPANGALIDVVGSTTLTTVANASLQYTWSNTQTFQNTITFSTSILGNTVNAAAYTVGTSFVANTSRVTVSGIPLYANGGAGTSGQLLTSNGTTGAPYWSTVPGVNTSAQYTWTNTQTFSNTITFNGAVISNEATRVVTVASSTTVVDLNTGDGATHFLINMGANSTIKFTNPPTAVTSNNGVFTFSAQVYNTAAGYSLTWAANTSAGMSGPKWAGGIVPPRTTANAATDVWTFFIINNVVYGSLAIINAS